LDSRGRIDDGDIGRGVARGSTTTTSVPAAMGSTTATTVPAADSGSDGERVVAAGGHWLDLRRRAAIVVVTVLVVVWVDGGGERRWWWRVAAMVVVVAAVVVVVVGGGGGARAAGRWARCLGIAFFCFMKISFAESFPTLGTPVTRGLCRPSGTESAVPRVPSRHRLCREGLGLCQEHCTLGKAIESGSEWS
jgi:hypothetical protein